MSGTQNSSWTFATLHNCFANNKFFKMEKMTASLQSHSSSIILRTIASKFVGSLPPNCIHPLENQNLDNAKKKYRKLSSIISFKNLRWKQKSYTIYLPRIVLKSSCLQSLQKHTDPLTLSQSCPSNMPRSRANDVNLAPQVFHNCLGWKDWCYKIQGYRRSDLRWRSKSIRSRPKLGRFCLRV